MHFLVLLACGAASTADTAAGHDTASSADRCGSVLGVLDAAAVTVTWPLDRYGGLTGWTFEGTASGTADQYCGGDGEILPATFYFGGLMSSPAPLDLGGHEGEVLGLFGDATAEGGTAAVKISWFADIAVGGGSEASLE